MMKAVIVTKLGGPEGLVYQTVEDPAPSAKQVLIQVAARGINFADIKARQGRYHGAGEPPFIPGLDVAGTVIQVGEAVKEFQVGQRVIAFPSEGSYGELAVADEVLTYPLPDSIDFEVAAAFPVVAVTAFNLLKTVGRLEPAEKVLIHAAAGGIGTTAIQMAKVFGASTVIGTVSSAAKAEIALQAGADHVIVTDQQDFVKEVQELTRGQGVDLILDSVAGPVFERGFDCLAHFGRVVMFGNASGSAGQFDSNGLHSSCRSVLGYSMGTTRKLRPHLLRNSVMESIQLLESGQLKMVIGRRYPLAEAAEAHAFIESRESTGKVLLV